MSKPTYEQLYTFVQRLADLPKDGEELCEEDGYEEDDDGYDLSNDEAVDTYHALIDEARELVGDDDSEASKKS